MRAFALPDLREGCAVSIQVIFQIMQHSISFLGTFYVSSLHGYMLVLRALPPPPPPRFFSAAGSFLNWRRVVWSLLWEARPQHAAGACAATPAQTRRMPGSANKDYSVEEDPHHGVTLHFCRCGSECDPSFHVCACTCDPTLYDCAFTCDPTAKTCDPTALSRVTLQQERVTLQPKTSVTLQNERVTLQV